MNYVTQKELDQAAPGLASSPAEGCGSPRRRDYGNETIAPENRAALFSDSLLRQWLERFLALILFVATAPIMVLIYLRIRFGSEGPPLFFQERVGLGGKTFRFVKFRTMYVDARTRFPELYQYKYSEEEFKEFKFKITDDPRVTPEGRWLRKSSLDELPNLWNVITGDMAFVGPRPEIPEMVNYYNGSMLEKFSVRPGVTGLAQASGRGHLTFRDTVAYDIEYVRRRSLFLDINILFRTLVKVCQRDGAF